MGNVTLVTPEYVVREARRVLSVKFALTEEAIETGLAEIAVAATPNPPVAAVAEAAMLIQDRADAPVVAAALQAKVHALVTGDIHFFSPAVQASIRVLTPRQALDLVMGSGPGAGSEADGS